MNKREEQERFFEMVRDADTEVEDILKYFRENRKSIDLEETDKERGDTVFHVLARNGDDSIIDGLLRELSTDEIRSVLTLKNDGGYTPLAIGTQSVVSVMTNHICLLK